MADKVVAVSGGGMHTLFQKSDGSLWGVGYNASAQLGYVDDSEEGDSVLVTKPVKILDGVKLTGRSAEFIETALKVTPEKFFQSVPLYVWILAGAAVVIVILLLVLIFSLNRMRRLRKAATTAVAQVQLLQRQQEKLRESKGTQRKAKKQEEKKSDQ